MVTGLALTDTTTSEILAASTGSWSSVTGQGPGPYWRTGLEANTPARGNCTHGSSSRNSTGGRRHWHQAEQPFPTTEWRCCTQYRAFDCSLLRHRYYVLRIRPCRTYWHEKPCTRQGSPASSRVAEGGEPCAALCGWVSHRKMSIHGSLRGYPAGENLGSLMETALTP